MAFNGEPSFSGQLTFPLCGAANTRQLRQQNFCSRWTSAVELSSALLVNKSYSNGLSCSQTDARTRG